MSYKIIRFYADSKLGNETIVKGLTLEKAQAYCRNPETSWRTATSDAAHERTRLYGPWFDGFSKE